MVVKEPRSIDKWNLDEKSMRVVKRELSLWLDHFIDKAEKETANVYRCDFINWDFFYFTKCHDLMKQKKEGLAVESSRDINFRKDQVFMQLFIKTLLNKIEIIKTKCTHCGEDTIVDSVYKGHWYYCPSCGKADVSVYAETAPITFNAVTKKMWERERLRG